MVCAKEHSRNKVLQPRHFLKSRTHWLPFCAALHALAASPHLVRLIIHILAHVDVIALMLIHILLPRGRQQRDMRLWQILSTLVSVSMFA